MKAHPGKRQTGRGRVPRRETAGPADVARERRLHPAGHEGPGHRTQTAPDEIRLRTRKDDLILQVLHEDRESIVIDKPPGWMLAPVDWDRTQRNLMRLLIEGVQQGDHWAVRRNLRFIRPAHRLDADTSGALLLARNPVALRRLNRLFATRQVRKLYLAMVHGRPHRPEWECDLPLALTPGSSGRVQVDAREGRPALTRFRVLQSGPAMALLECEPVTGRTHQIRVHLEAAGLPIVGDPLYRRGAPSGEPVTGGLGLRAALLEWPGIRGRESAVAPCGAFVQRHGFQAPNLLGG